MKLTYHTGKNFGDAINPLIFKSLLPGFFDEDKKNIFLGIGSILGLKRPGPNVDNVIVFSSGIGGENNETYGSPPSKKVLKKYDFRCVRGALTAKLFNLPVESAVCDGAILLSEIGLNFNDSTKMYNYSYMPHIGSLSYFSGWKELLDSLGIQFINPTDDINFIIKEINCTEILFTEAMHGAIVADTLRVPWIPVKSKESINEFKWKDFCSSLNIKYKPVEVNTLYDPDFMRGIINNKDWINSEKAKNLITKSYLFYQNNYVEKKVKKKFNSLKDKKTILSNASLLNSKKEQLLNILHNISKDYSKKELNSK